MCGGRPSRGRKRANDEVDDAHLAVLRMPAAAGAGGLETAVENHLAVAAIGHAEVDHQLLDHLIGGRLAVGDGLAGKPGPYPARLDAFAEIPSRAMADIAARALLAGQLVRRLRQSLIGRQRRQRPLAAQEIDRLGEGARIAPLVVDLRRPSPRSLCR